MTEDQVSISLQSSCSILTAIRSNAKTVEPEKGIINAKLGTKVFIRLHITFYLFICFPMN